MLKSATTDGTSVSLRTACGAVHGACGARMRQPQLALLHSPAAVRSGQAPRRPLETRWVEPAQAGLTCA
eukprot:364861-Chlamydomonas_euryale.AAC.20